MAWHCQALLPFGTSVPSAGRRDRIETALYEPHHLQTSKPSLAQTGQYTSKAITQILGAKVAKITRNGRQIDGPPRVHQIDGRFWPCVTPLQSVFYSRRLD